jgi:hypothetical protein
LLVVNVTGANEHARLDGFGRNTTIAVSNHFGNEFLLGEDRSAQKKQSQQQAYEPKHKGP